MFRLIAADMDETLLDSRAGITPRTMNALRRCMDAGAMFTLSSGRMLEAMEAQAREIPVNAPIIMFNGAMIYDLAAGQALFKRAIPAETARAICRAAEDRGLYIQYYPGEDYFCPARTSLTYPYEKRIGVRARETGEKLSQWIREDAVKLLALGNDPAEISSAIPVFREMFPEVNFATSHPTYLEIVAKGIDKGNAIRALAKAVNVPIQDTLTFGDGGNDVPMLRAAGRAYAMQGSQAALACPDHIAPPYDQDGVAQVLERLLDEGLIGRG